MRHRGETPIACSLEPCADVRTAVLSQLNRVTKKRNKTTARVTTCSKRHVSARVIQSFYRNRCGALGPTAVEDYLISEQQVLGPGFVPDQQHCQQILLSHAPKLLTVQRLWKTRKETKGVHLLALPATCKNLWHRREKTKRPAVPAQHTNRRTCLVSVQTLCTAQQGSRDNTRTYRA